MSLLLENKILQATEDKIEGGLTPENRQDYMKIVVAGMKAGLANGPNGIMASIKNSKDPVNDCAKGAVNLVFLLRKQVRGMMPIKAMVPAGMTLMLHALDVVDKMGLAKIGVAEVGQATNTFTNIMFRNLGITSQMLLHAHDSVTKAMQNPATAEAIKRKSGMVRAPGSSTPTPVPDEPTTGSANTSTGA